jgi:hypothetical protein
MFDSIDTPAPWAYSWCWVYYFGAVLTIIIAVVVAVSSWKKLNAASLIGLGLVAVIQTMHGLTYFWTCRAALKPGK